MFSRVLIANRGEIAVRVTQTLQQMGITAIAVYSEPDCGAPHMLQADEAYPLEGTTPAQTYLDSQQILDIAKAHRIDAIHPGYGFLSENAEFASACETANITFIGPSADVIRAMGDKITAKKLFADAGVPTVPGWSGAVTAKSKEAAKAAKQIGFPVLIKAAAGGGGKGMRVVEEASELDAAIESAQREATAAFGDGRVFIEKYIDKPRHVEFQIFSDNQGHHVHLFERECSIQRRHQKIIEESPSPALTPALRECMGQAAVQAAKAVGYTNAGTVEFMVDQAGSFYFLEVNTRLQVEHPVTEAITGFDLVRAQLLVAAGEPLPFTQKDLTQRGHAIECRVYAEDSARNFLPSTGKISHFRAPLGPGIRVDTGVTAGFEVSVHFDPMLAKLIVWGQDRLQAIERMIWALDRFVVMGVTTNIGFMRDVIDHPAFRAGDLHTHFLTEHNIVTNEPAEMADEVLIAAALSAGTVRTTDSNATETTNGAATTSPWLQAGGWRAW